MFALKKIAGTTLSALAVAGMLMTSVAPASAQPYRDHWRGSWGHHRDYRHHHHHRHYNRHHHRHHHRHHRRDNSAAVGILGLGAGLILGGALANSANAAPPPPPPPVTYYGSPRAWTPQWRAYCTSRYRSFNPRTGYFLGYDGDYHFCR